MTGRTPLLLVGAGGHAKACIDVIEREGRFAIAGLLDSAQKVGNRLLGYRVLGTDADAGALRADYAHALVTVGQIESPDARMRLFDMLERHHYQRPTIISPHACVSSHAGIGAGTIVMHGAVVNAAATVGRNCILNSRSLIEHDAVIGDHCHIATSAVINGGVVVGTGTFVGSGSIVREYLELGERCVIGMGRRVLRDCADGTVLAKEPACVP